MKRYGLYWLRALTLGAGLNFVIVSSLMTHRGWKLYQAAPIAAFICVNCSFAADRLIFGRKKKKVVPIITPTHTPHSCPVCTEYPCICESWNIK
jgi:hypothetical protein